GALVLAIDDPVAVPVLVRAAVVVLRAGLGRALVLIVRDAVVVAVLDQDGRRRRGRFAAAEREAEAEHELAVGRILLRALVGDAVRARVQPQVNDVVEEVLRAAAAVELEVGVFLDRDVRRLIRAHVGAGRRDVQHADAREDERDELSARDLARHDVVNEGPARPDDEHAVAAGVHGRVARLRRHPHALGLDRERRVQQQPQAQAEQRGVLRAGQRPHLIVGDAQLDGLVEQVDAAADAYLELDPFLLGTLSRRLTRCYNQNGADGNRKYGARAPPGDLSHGASLYPVWVDFEMPPPSGAAPEYLFRSRSPGYKFAARRRCLIGTATPNLENHDDPFRRSAFHRHDFDDRDPGGPRGRR